MPVEVIKAVQLSADNFESVAKWCGAVFFFPNTFHAAGWLELTIMGETNPQRAKAYETNWIVLEESGFQVYAEDVYYETYPRSAYTVAKPNLSVLDAATDWVVTPIPDYFKAIQINTKNVKSVALWCDGYWSPYMEAGNHANTFYVGLKETMWINDRPDRAILNDWIVKLSKTDFRIFSDSEYQKMGPEDFNALVDAKRRSMKNNDEIVPETISSPEFSKEAKVEMIGLLVLTLMWQHEAAMHKKTSYQIHLMAQNTIQRICDLIV